MPIVQNKKITKIHPAMLAIPAMCDVTSQTLQLIGLALVPPSIYQMSRGFVVVFTAILSIVFLKRKLYRHHWTGIVLVMVGVAEGGFIDIFRGSSDNSSAAAQLFGILLILLA